VANRIDSVSKTGSFPLVLERTAKRDVRTQFAALCFKQKKSGTKVLLVTSRDTGRWVIPKGWPMNGKTAEQCVAIEAWEEAGARGPVSDGCIGIYSYIKELDTGVNLPIVVAVFSLRVSELHSEYPEVEQRERKWVSLKKAARLVDEPELAQLLIRFKPRGT